MSCPEWRCSCGMITFGFSKTTSNPEMKCNKCGKILTHSMYDEEDEERALREEDKQHTKESSWMS